MYLSARPTSDCGCGCKGRGACGDSGDGLAGFVPVTTGGKIALAIAAYVVWRMMRK